MDSENMWLPGMAAYSKDRCKYCNVNININPIGLIIGIVFNLSITHLIYATLIEIGKRIPADIQDALGMFAFAAFLPFGIIAFYILSRALITRH